MYGVWASMNAYVHWYEGGLSFELHGCGTTRDISALKDSPYSLKSEFESELKDVLLGPKTRTCRSD
jgi:hypothetical protein